MSLKWTGNSSEFGILRKSEFKEKKEELFVFGYSCKLFREDEKALHIDQGKHLIPWMGDETLKIDRYDARGALHDVSRLEAPPGGYDWRVELTRTEQEVEQLCDEERYRALHTNEDEEEMYKEEELKRLHAAGYGQVGFNYDAPAAAQVTPTPTEVDEPFEPTVHYRSLFAPDTPFPDTEKLNAIIEKTAKFIASQGAQMEILIKAKQGDNPQFQFLNRECELHSYYMALIGLIRAGKWPEQRPDVNEDKLQEHEDYLHPSLASAVIESAPSIPSIHYRPSADCDYTMLISKMRGEAPPEEPYVPTLAPGEVAPPGTEPLPLRLHADIAKAPVMYHKSTAESSLLIPPVATASSVPSPLVPSSVPPPQAPQYAAYYHQYMAHAAKETSLNASEPSPSPQTSATPPPAAPPAAPSRSTGLSLMKNYNTDSGSDVSDCDDSSSTESKRSVDQDTPNIVVPPESIQLVIDKMAAYVARNGIEFAEIVRAKGDPRFTFLNQSDVHHGYYCEILREKRGEGKARIPKPPVSFSIKKLKEPEPVLPKPALPYESSTEEEDDVEKETENKDKQIDNVDSPKIDSAPDQNTTSNNLPVVLYKVDGTQVNLSTVKPLETPKLVPKPAPIPTPPIAEVKLQKKEKTSVQAPPTKYPITPIVEKKKSPEIKQKKTKETKRSKDKDKDKKEHKEKSKSSNRDKRNEKEKKRERESSKAKRKIKNANDDLESEIISLEDTSDVCIDLTGDLSDSKVEDESEGELEKQAVRRRRAAEFLRKVGVDPGAAALPASSLASAMVDTLQSIRKKKEEEEEKKRKREKRRRRDRHGHESNDKSHRKSKRRKYKTSDEDDSDHERDSSKRKKRKKDKKSSKSKKKKTKEVKSEEEEPEQTSLNIDLSTTLKGLRTTSPTKEIVLQDLDGTHTIAKDSSTEDEEVEDEEIRTPKKKEDREYSEGEWSSDSEKDSEASVPSKNGD